VEFVHITQREEGMRPTPYIGVTGICKKSEVEAIVRDLALESHAKLMLGTLVSHKTLHGGVSASHPERYPLPQRLHSLMSSDRRVLNLIHFNTKEPEFLFEDLLHAQQVAGPLCHGFQLNMTWPDAKVLARYKEAHHRGSNILVLQCGRRALGEVDHSPEMLLERVRHYQGLVEYVLIDTSGGEGKPFDISKTLDYFESLEKIDDICFGVAGGLGVHTLFRLLRLWRKFPCFSIDAETSLRDEHDALSTMRVRNYVATADQIFVQQKIAHQYHQ
jgi:hypothetical protein